MNYLIVLIVLSAVTYRVSRFIVLDSLIDEPRDWAVDRLERKRGLFYSKLVDFIGCPFCISIWVAAATVAVHHFVVEDVPVPVWTWLAVATGSLLLWAWIDSE